MLKTEGRSRLSAVLRGGRTLITVDDATQALGIGRSAAAKVLARWERQGWVTRVQRGLYAPVPLASKPGDQVVEDPWTLIPELFGTAYIGGASAAHHWDLTEQLFRSVFVCTTQSVRRKTHTVYGTTFILRHVAEDELFGTRALWRGRTKLQVSDPHRTVIDMLDDSASGGGIRHVADCLQNYLKRADASPETLVDYADRIGNGAVFKRLGFLAERAGGPQALIAACAQRLTMGNAKLDPAMPCPRLIRRWRLWVPEIGDDYIVFTQRPNYQAEAGWKNEGERLAYIQANKLRLLRPYQLKAILSLQSAVKDGKDRFLFEMATGTGKTLTAAAVIKRISRP